MTQMLIVSSSSSAAAWLLLLCCSVCCFLPSNCVVDPPKSLKIKGYPDKLYISWEASSTPNVEYLVKCNDIIKRRTLTNEFIDYLQPESEYSVSVTAYLPSSSPIVYSDSLVGIGRTSVTPVDFRSIRVTALSDTSLSVTWQRPNSDRISHFQLRCNDVMVNTTDNTAVCKELTPNEKYPIAIFTFSDTFGASSSETSVRAIVNATVTQPLVISGIFNITNNSLLITWLPSLTPNAQYEVQCSASNTIRTSDMKAVCCCYESFARVVDRFGYTQISVGFNVSVRAIGSSLLPTEWNSAPFYLFAEPIDKQLESMVAGSDWLSLVWLPRNRTLQVAEAYSIFYFSANYLGLQFVEENYINLTGLVSNTVYDIFIIDPFDTKPRIMYLQYRAIDPPKSLDVISTHDMIEIRWLASSAPNVKYLVKCGDRTGSIDGTYANFRNLQPESEYNVSVTAYLPSSSPIVYSDSLVGIGRTSVTPVDYRTIKVTALSDTSLSVTWQRPNSKSAAYFQLRCRDVRVNTTDTTAVCKGLIENNVYDISIYTYSYGFGYSSTQYPISAIANASVTQRIPDYSINAFNITSNSLLVSWYPSLTPNAQYEVQCSANSTIRTSETKVECCCYEPFEIVKSFGSQQFKVGFAIAVRAIGGAALLPTAWDTNIFYALLTPIGYRLKSVQAGSDWLSISWFPRNEAEEEKVYRVVYFASDLPVHQFVYKTRITLTGLMSNTSYDIIIVDSVSRYNEIALYLRYGTLAAE